MEALPIPGTYIIRNIHDKKAGLYDIQWCPPYEDSPNELDDFLEAYAEASDSTGWNADIQEEYPDYIDGSLFGSEEKLIAECWVPRNGVNDDCDHLCGQWFLVKYHGYPFVRSRWRRLVTEGDEYLHHGHSIRIEWEQEKKRLRKGESTLFDLQWYYGQLIDKNIIKHQRAGLRRFKKVLEYLQGALEAEKLDVEDYQESEIDTSR